MSTETATEIQYQVVIGKCPRCKIITKKNFSANDSSTSVWIDCTCGMRHCGRTAKTTEKTCGARCRNAVGPACDCSCGGKHHAEQGVWA